jgi:hypothetical protein
VTAGTSFALTVPPTSVLRGLDTGTLETAEVSLLDVSGYGSRAGNPSCSATTRPSSRHRGPGTPP